MPWFNTSKIQQDAYFKQDENKSFVEKPRRQTGELCFTQKARWGRKGICQFRFFDAAAQMPAGRRKKKRPGKEMQQVRIPVLNFNKRSTGRF